MIKRYHTNYLNKEIITEFGNLGYYLENRIPIEMEDVYLNDKLNNLFDLDIAMYRHSIKRSEIVERYLVINKNSELNSFIKKFNESESSFKLDILEFELNYYIHLVSLSDFDKIINYLNFEVIDKDTYDLRLNFFNSNKKNYILANNFDFKFRKNKLINYITKININLNNSIHSSIESLNRYSGEIYPFIRKIMNELVLTSELDQSVFNKLLKDNLFNKFIRKYQYIQLK